MHILYTYPAKLDFTKDFFQIWLLAEFGKSQKNFNKNISKNQTNEWMKQQNRKN
jgi:hypothetical protein